MSQIWKKIDDRGVRRQIGVWIAIGPLALSMCSTVEGQSGPKLAQLPIPVPAVIQHSMLVSHKNANDVIHLALSLYPSNPSGLKTFVDNVSNPKSLKYKKWATPVQLGQMFGQPATTVQSVVNYLKSNGFKVTLVGASRLTILADATISQAEKAFDTTINNYHSLLTTTKTRTDFYAFAEPIHVPTSFAATVLTVSGLDDIAKPIPRLRKHVLTKSGKGKVGLTKGKFNSVPLTPTQTRTLYGTASIYGAGLKGQSSTVAISSFDGFRLTNVPLYYSAFSLPTPTGGVGSNITVTAVDGGSGSGTPGAEGDLDIQMVLGMAPLCNFIVYDGGGDLIDVLTKEQDDNLADVISESYGWVLSPSDAEACHNEHALMSAQGITYMEATGDYGTTLEPAAYSNYEPDCFQVGGSVANTDSSGNRLNETGWSGSGGGWATDNVPFNVLPSWQAGTGVPTNINFRLNPDVALNAYNDVGAYQFYLNGALTFGYDGTSFASPVFAGSLGVTEQQIVAYGGTKRLGRISDAIYVQDGRPDVWFDITTGTNGTLPNGNVSSCTPFWDFVTGWGAINFAAYAQSVAVTPPQYFPVATVNPFDNTELARPVVEGTNPSGSAATLNSGGGYVLTAVDEPAIGEVATIQAAFSATPIGSTNPIDNSKIRQLSFAFNGTVAPQATIMLYALDQTVGNANSGKFVYIKSISGTAFGSATTVALNKSQVTEFVPATGSIQVLVRYLVPNDRLTQVSQFTLALNQLQMVAVLSLN